MNSLDTEPMMSLDKFIEQAGLFAVTVWRYREKGMLTTVNICGRQYILRAEIARFNQRAAAGEFARHLLDRGSDWQLLFTFRASVGLIF